MNEFIIGTDTIVGVATKTAFAKTQPPPVNFLQRPAFGGLRVWQAGLAGIGVAMLAGGVITLVVRK